MNSCGERLKNGLINENPIFVLMLGMCPTLAVTTSAMNGIGMGLSTTAVLVMSNMLISMLRKIIPDSVRMPAFIVVVASFVTIVDFLMKGYTPSLYDSLGIYITLIVVNCHLAPFLSKSLWFSVLTPSQPPSLLQSARLLSQSRSPPRPFRGRPYRSAHTSRQAWQRYHLLQADPLRHLPYRAALHCRA